MKRFLLINIFMTLTITVIGQKLVPLNKYGFEILDTTEYDIKYYLQSVDTSENETIKKVFDLDNDLFTLETINKKKKKKKIIPIDSEKTFFNSEGDTLKKIHHNYSTSKKSVTYYSNGQISSYVIYEESRFKEGAFKNGQGEFISMERDEQTPNLKVSYDKYINFLSSELSYPKEARRKGIEGVVYLALKISSEGILEGIDVMNPEHVSLLLQAEATRVMAGYDMGFYPARDSTGVPIREVLRAPINFRLK